jgi:hypothetical protein
MFYMFFVFIYAYWWPTRFPNQMMFVSPGNTTSVTCEARTADLSGASEFLVGFVLLDL